MYKIIGNLTISEILDYFKNKCKEIGCVKCPFRFATCGSFESELEDFIEEVGEGTLIEVDEI